MTVYFGSSDDIDFVLTGASKVITNSTYFDPVYSRSAIQVFEAPDGAAVNLSADLTTLYVSCRWRQISPGWVGADLEILTISQGGTAIARIKALDGVWYLQTYDGGWQNRGSAWVDIPADDVVSHFTLKVVLHGTSGEITAWIGSVEAATWTGDTIGDTGATGMNKLVFTSPDPGPNDYASISEVIVADEQTINMRCATLVPNADGTNTAWANGYAAVDEAVEDPGDTIQSDVADQVETMNLSAYGGSVDLIVRCVSVSVKAARGPAGPQNLQLAVREGTTEGFSASKALDEVYATYSERWELNPDTAAAWEVPELAGLEAGVKSIT